MTAQTRGLVVIVVVLALVTLGGPFMMGGMMAPGWMGTDGGWHSGMLWGVGGLTMLAFWALILVGVVWLVRWLDENRPAGEVRHETPGEILRQRYAAGELTREQFDQMKRDLEGPST